MTIYYEGWKEKEITCEDCGWQGNSGTCEPGTMYKKTYLELFCPKCHETVDIIDFSTFKGCDKGHGDLSDDQKKALAEEAEEESKFLALCLQSPDQLPDIAENEFELIWDQEGGDTRVMKGELIIWNEPVSYEGFNRFERIAMIIKEKYGSRVKDLAPTDRSRLFLHGDYFPSLHYVRTIRKELFGMITEKEF
jgi:hypothetical protein